MAEATLNDVIVRLRTDNEKQLREQRDTTVAVEELSGTIRALLEQMEAQRLRDKESEFEARRRVTAPSAATGAASPVSSGGILDLLGPGSMLSALTGIAANLGGAAIALAAVTEGFGPSLKTLGRFTTGLMKLQKALIRIPVYPFERLLGASLFDDVTKNLSKMENVLKGRYAFDPRSMRWKNLLTNKFAPFDEVNRAAKEANGFLTRISSLFKSITIPESITKIFSAEGAIGKGFDILKNNKWVTGIVKFLRPLAVILSLFDGFRTAGEEMEEREGFFNKYLGGGLGGFIGGFIGSFIGELGNLIKDIPLFLISYLVPDDYITTNPDGTWQFNESKNIFTKLLAGIQKLDFNQLLKDLVMLPFNAIGNALDYIGQYFGLSGTEEQQTATQKMFDEWWNNWFSLKGAGENAGGIVKWLVNTAMAPINSILDSVLEAFGVSTDGEETTFLQKISDFVSWIYGLVPSVDDIKRRLASSLGPDIASYLGLSEYLPQTQADFENRSQELLKVIQDTNSKAAELEAQIAARENSGVQLNRSDAARKGSLIAAQEARDEAQRELETLIASARTSPGINQSTVNNVQSQSDTIFMPNSGSIDNDDIRR